MDSIAVANEETNRYQSYSMSDPVTAAKVLSILTNDVSFAGPFTLVGERDVYLPQDEKHEQEEEKCLSPDREVIVYDAYGPHGIQRIGTGYESTAGVKAWIDERLESESDGEYVIGHIIRPERFEMEEGESSELKDLTLSLD